MRGRKQNNKKLCNNLQESISSLKKVGVRSARTIPLLIITVTGKSMTQTFRGKVRCLNDSTANSGRG